MQRPQLQEDVSSTSTRGELNVREEYDADGDLYWAIVAMTYDRRALDVLSDALNVRLRIVGAGS